MSRRAALRRMAITAGATVGSYLLAACQSAPAAPAASPAAQPTGAPAAAPGAKRQGGKVTWAIAVDPTSLAPFGVLAGAAHEGKELLYDSLVQWDRLKAAGDLRRRVLWRQQRGCHGGLDHQANDRQADQAYRVVASRGRQATPPTPPAQRGAHQRRASRDRPRRLGQRGAVRRAHAYRMRGSR